MTVRRTPADLTLRDLADRVKHPWGGACACVGGEWCCIRVWRQEDALQRGAHITARLLTDYAERLDTP